LPIGYAARKVFNSRTSYTSMQQVSKSDTGFSSKTLVFHSSWMSDAG
jgi:hypothetical protein